MIFGIIWVWVVAHITRCRQNGVSIAKISASNSKFENLRWTPYSHMNHRPSKSPVSATRILSSLPVSRITFTIVHNLILIRSFMHPSTHFIPKHIITYVLIHTNTHFTPWTHNHVTKLWTYNKTTNLYLYK